MLIHQHRHHHHQHHHNTNTNPVTGSSSNNSNINSSIKLRTNKVKIQKLQKNTEKQTKFEILKDNIKFKNMDNMDSISLGNFKVLYLVTQLIGATLIVLMASWIGIHLDGFAWRSNPKIEFNWHPFLMTFGLIFLYGNSILIYRGLRQTRKKKLKLIHASIHMSAFILTVIALIAVFDSHNLVKDPIPNMYSLHSWIGLATVILFSFQWIGGFFAYLVPGVKQNMKEAIMPYHIYFGLTGFVMAIATALLGLTEKIMFTVKGDYANLPNSALMVNFMGVLIIVFGILVVYLATERNYKRLPLPEDAILLTGAND